MPDAERLEAANGIWLSASPLLRLKFMGGVNTPTQRSD